VTDQPTGAAPADGDGDDGGEDAMYGWRVRGIRAALADRGLAEGPLTVEDLTALGHLDQYHYYGTAACDEAARILGLDADRRVLDVGSGVGGPARYLAGETGCSVHGIELREELVAVARELTGRVGLADRVSFTAGDAAAVDLPAGGYDHAVAWLVLLHVPDRIRLLENCRRALRSGGTVLAEAFVLDDPTPAHRRALREVVEAPDLPAEADLVGEFRAAGFEDVVTCELTDAWREWTAARADRFADRREQFVALHGRETYERRAGFYHTVRDLFAGGAVRGLRLTARVPGGDPLALVDRERTALDGREAAVLEGTHSG
jgi:cyclopropane fatty-acyl-phospholipid synthase-like methyltransferase